MASLIYQPADPGPTSPLEVRVGTSVLSFEPGLPHDVPAEWVTPTTVAIRASQGNMVSPTCTIATTLGAAGAQSYAVVAVNANGDTLQPTVTSTATGPTTLDGTHFNDVNWTGVTGATGYKVIRTAGGPSQGWIGSLLPATATTLRDNGLAATAYTPAGAAVSQAGVIVSMGEL